MVHVLNSLVTLTLTLTLFCGKGSGGGGTTATAMASTTITSSEPLTPANLLPADVQVSTFLKKAQPKTFYYWSSLSEGPLSLTMSPCTAAVRWSLHFQEKNDTTSLGTSLSLGDLDTSFSSTRSLQTFHTTARRGLFSVRLEAIDSDGGVALYVSTEPGGPQPLQLRHPPLRLQHRQRRTQLTVKWNQSLVDPHVTDYCLVVNQKRNYSSLCEALEERFGPGSSEVNLPDLSKSKPKSRAIKRYDSWDKSKVSRKDPQITCVGPNTQYTLTSLEHGKMYHLNLFAVNRQSNFTYPFGSAELRFSSHVKPTALRDGKPAFVNLKKLDGKAVFRYKVGRKSTDPLHLYVMPCGGAVDVEVTLRTTPVEQRRRVDGYGKLVIPNPVRGQRYYIRVVTVNREELKRTSGVEVLAWSRPSPAFPLPHLPAVSAVHEYTSLRRCDSVTVGWLPARDPGPQRYCLQASEGRLHDPATPNHCLLDHRRNRRQDFTVKYCQDITRGDSKVITQKISQLKSGRNYVIQVTVKKPKGKTLSYDLLQVHTKKYCDHSNKFN